MKLTFLLLLLSCVMHAQSWTFQQGYILEDSTVTIITRPIECTVLPNMILLNTLELMYDRTEVRDGILTFYLSNGGILLYTESGPHGPGIAMLHSNVRVVAWTIIQEAFQIDIR